MRTIRVIDSPLGTSHEVAVPHTPAVYLPVLLDHELVSYADKYASTPLEKELLGRFAKLVGSSTEECPGCGCSLT